MELTRKKIFIRWLVGSLLASVIGVMIAVIYLTLSGPLHVPGEEVVSEIFGNYFAVLIMLPIGLFISLILPWGWISIGCLVWATRKNSEHSLFGAFFMAFLFGLFWPNIFFTMMSV